MEDFPKRKELASLKQLFVLYGKFSIFLYAPPLHAGVFLYTGNMFTCQSAFLTYVYRLFPYRYLFLYQLILYLFSVNTL